MNCGNEGELRSHIDGELNPADAAAMEAHLAGCESCRATVSAMRADAALAAGLVAAGPVPASAASAVFRRVEARRLAEEQPARANQVDVTAGSIRTRIARRPVLGGAVLTALLAAMLAVLPLQSFATALTQQFRVQQFAAVTIRVPSMKGVPEPGTSQPYPPVGGSSGMPGSPGGADGKTSIDAMLNRFGTLTSTRTPQSQRQVPSLDAARAHFATDSARNGGVLKTVPADTLPAGAASLPVRYLVSDSVTGTYVLDVAAVKQQATSMGKTDLANLPWPNTSQLPFGFDIPAAVVVTYGTGDQSFGYLQMASPTLTVPSELDVNAFRAAVLALPGLPADTVAQIKAVKDWQKTLIIPVPADAVTENVTIGGSPGLLILDGASRGGVVMWQANGVLYAVGGHLTRDQLLAAANGMR